MEVTKLFIPVICMTFLGYAGCCTDVPGLVIASPNCSMLMLVYRGYCYPKYGAINVTCCASCAAVYTCEPNCEYGDRIDICHYTPCNTKSADHLEKCCETCAAKPLTGCTTTAVATTTPTTTTSNTQAATTTETFKFPDEGVYVLSGCFGLLILNMAFVLFLKYWKASTGTVVEPFDETQEQVITPTNVWKDTA